MMPGDAISFCADRERSVANPFYARFRSLLARGAGKMMLVVGLLAAPTLIACNTVAETVRFEAAAPHQEVTFKDGDHLLVSRAKSSLVTVRRAPEAAASGRTVFVLGIQNLSRQALDFRMANVSAADVVDGKPAARLKVYSYDELVAEEKTTQFGKSFFAAVLAGVADANHEDTEAGDQIIAETREAHIQKLGDFRDLSLIDHQIGVGETYVGKLHIQAPGMAGFAAKRTQVISVSIGPDRHDIFANLLSK